MTQAEAPVDTIEIAEQQPEQQQVPKEESDQKEEWLIYFNQNF